MSLSIANIEVLLVELVVNQILCYERGDDQFHLKGILEA
jgi:hypothetical protein